MDPRTLEELELNAWPSLSSVLYDGWILRFGGGFTRRANSINPLYASSLPLGEKIDECEAAYARRNQPAVFKLTPASQPPALDSALAGAGYEAQATTSVQVADLTSQAPTGDPAMLQSIVPPRAFATLRQDGRPLALGLAVAERGYVGLSSIVTAVDVRNQGLGRRLVGHLLAWGQQHGAHTAHLAVMRDNAPALRLYAGFGFREAYCYWYRAKALS
jgi:ribosomal protein S18 acetylase RimI-like enzyme